MKNSPFAKDIYNILSNERLGLKSFPLVIYFKGIGAKSKAAKRQKLKIYIIKMLNTQTIVMLQKKLHTLTECPIIQMLPSLKARD